MQSPILFLVFNRPEPTRRVFQALRAARPPRLYVAADGSRSGQPGEAIRCEETRLAATEIDWPCELETLFRPHNLGCKQAVSQAIDWFFEHEPEGIILEDDCLPDPSFFRFCDELLRQYREDERIGLISGDNFQFGRTYGEASYYFSRYAHIWGWASWRRAWRNYDRDIETWPSFRDAGGLETVLGQRREIRHWRKTLDAMHAHRIDTWDHQLNFMLWSQNMISIMPQKNLVTNIGFGPDATHTNSASRFADLPAQSIDFPLVHPSAMYRCNRADDYTWKEMLLRSLPSRVLSRLRTLARGR